MSIAFKIHNIISSCLDKEISSVLVPHQSIFDKIYETLDISVSLLKKEEIIKPSNIFVSNNILSHSKERKALGVKYHIKDLIFFHEIPNPQFKKEDKMILRNGLNSCNKIVFHEQIAKAWGLSEDQNTNIIDYGIPIMQTEKTSPKKSRKSVIILNFKHGQIARDLHNYIKQANDDSVCIESMPSSLQQFANIVSEYRVCIDINDYINVLFSASCGVIAIGADSFDPNIDSSMKMTDYSNIHKVISDIMSIPEEKYHELIKKNSDYIHSKYSMINFTNKMMSLMSSIKSEPFYHET